MELINYIIDWIENGASVAVDGILLGVDQRCEIVLQSFSDPECHEMTTQTYALPTTTQGESTATAISQSSTVPYVETTVATTEMTTNPSGMMD